MCGTCGRSVHRASGMRAATRPGRWFGMALPECPRFPLFGSGGSLAPWPMVQPAAAKALIQVKGSKGSFVKAQRRREAKKREIVMKKISLKRAMLAAAVVVCGVSGSIDWASEGLSYSVESAQARVGRPLTPVSVAGVARRTTRRAVVGGAVVGGAVAGCVRVLVNGRY